MKRLAVLLTLAALAPLAHAGDDTDDSKKKPTDREVRYQQVTEVIFGEVGVQGTVVGPDGRLVPGDPPRLQLSFLRLREDFEPEIKRSVDEVK